MQPGCTHASWVVLRVVWTVWIPSAAPLLAACCVADFLNWFFVQICYRRLIFSYCTKKQWIGFDLFHSSAMFWTCLKHDQTWSGFQLLSPCSLAFSTVAARCRFFLRSSCDRLRPADVSGRPQLVGERPGPLEFHVFSMQLVTGLVEGENWGHQGFYHQKSFPIKQIPSHSFFLQMPLLNDHRMLYVLTAWWLWEAHGHALLPPGTTKRMAMSLGAA